MPSPQPSTFARLVICIVLSAMVAASVLYFGIRRNQAAYHERMKHTPYHDDEGEHPAGRSN